jgi:hypothetical protein
MDLMGASQPLLPKECLVTLGYPAGGAVTTFLSIRYRLQSFKTGAETLGQVGMIIVI